MLAPIREEWIGKKWIILAKHEGFFFVGFGFGVFWLVGWFFCKLGWRSWDPVQGMPKSNWALIGVLRFLNYVGIFNYISMNFWRQINTFIKSKKSTPSHPHSLPKSQSIKMKPGSLRYIYYLSRLIFFLNHWYAFKAIPTLVLVSKMENAWIIWIDSILNQNRQTYKQK